LGRKRLGDEGDVVECDPLAFAAVEMEGFDVVGREAVDAEEGLGLGQS
jgi:hypothetical protein